MEFSRQEYWSRLAFLSSGNLFDPGIGPRSLALQADSLLSEPLGRPQRRKNDCNLRILVGLKWRAEKNNNYLFEQWRRILFYLTTPHIMQESQFPDQGSNLCPLFWKQRVLTTGPQQAPNFLSMIIILGLVIENISLFLNNSPSISLSFCMSVCVCIYTNNKEFNQQVKILQIYICMNMCIDK